MWSLSQAMIVLGMWKELLADMYKPATYKPLGKPLRWWEKK